MTMIADGLLLVAAFSAAFYCRILAIRLRRLGQTDQGLGGAISALNHQVDEMKATLAAVSTVTKERSTSLDRHTARAEAAARRLELLLAGLHEAEDRRAASPIVETLLKLSPKDRVLQANDIGARNGISRNVRRRNLANQEVDK